MEETREGKIAALSDAGSDKLEEEEEEVEKEKNFALLLLLLKWISLF